MACDEVLLRNSTCALLRVYAWAHPVWTFGYFQKLQEVQTNFGHTPINLMRRWTGGGMVDHTQDLPYSLILPSQHPWSQASTAESYRQIHTALLKTLQAQNIEASLQTEAPLTGAQCFQSPVTADVMLAGEKIAGAAQRRSRYGLLHQGSIQLPTSTFPTNSLNGSALLRDLGQFLGQQMEGPCTTYCEPTTLSAATSAAIAALAEAKYATAAWLQLR